MSSMAQAATEAYNTPRSPRVLQDAAAQWLGAAHYETELAVKCQQVLSRNQET